MDLVMEGPTISHRLPNSSHSKKKNLSASASRDFGSQMFHGKTKAAFELLRHNGEKSSLLQLIINHYYNW